MARLRISVWESPHIQAVILAMRGMDKELSAQIRKATKTVTTAEWKTAVEDHASTALERRTLVATARVAVSNKNVSLRAGQLAKKTSGGGKTYQLTPAVEFGADPERTIPSHKGATRYERKLGGAFKPRNKKGYVAYPAAADIIPRIAALWVATVVRTFHEAVEKGTR